MKKKGDKIKVLLKRNGKEFEVEGVVKDMRSSFGKTDYLVSDGTLKDFWTRQEKNEK